MRDEDASFQQRVRESLKGYPLVWPCGDAETEGVQYSSFLYDKLSQLEERTLCLIQ